MLLRDNTWEKGALVDNMLVYVMAFSISSTIYEIEKLIMSVISIEGLLRMIMYGE